ncbi:MAG TPA: MarR family winged helix-turn-helix transcriptional regulator [Vicinamibacterales bacterium]|nr:MarR family winged helix-turn-helix transcriptional regulator [Vicinamibacterales bacterium]
MGSHTSSFAADVRGALDAFRRIVQTLRLSSRDAERRVGLSAAQLFALQQLAGMSGASVNDLAARTFTHQSSVSVVVQRLVARRLVAKAPAADDRRRVRLSVTDAGRALLRRSPEPVQERLIAGIAALPARERRALVSALSAIADTLAVWDDAPPMLFEDGRARAAARPKRRAS